ncbi:MAG: DUF104 domain-containing protein [Gemmataceae bacterium]|nr:DUF104 domain-containing protein [Gemmataceae bacterium]
MGEAMSATYVDGVFKPDKPLNLPAGTRVRLVMFDVAPALSPEERQRALEDFNRVCDTLSIDLRGERLTRDQLNERR